MKKALFIFSILSLASLFCVSCDNSEGKRIVPNEPDAEVVDTDTEDVDTDTDTDPEPTETVSICGDKNIDEGEVCDGGAIECSEIDPTYTEGYAICKADCLGWDLSECQAIPTDPTDSTDPTEDQGEIDNVFVTGSFAVNTIDVKSGTDGAPRDFRIYEPAGAEGNVPVIHFLHGFMYKIDYYDNILTHLASHGFIVVSSQSTHKMIGGDTTIEEAGDVVTFINWLKQNIQSKVSLTADTEHFGVSGHSRGGKVTNRVLNSDPTIATSFFGVDPVDSAPPLGGNSDPNSLKDPVQFTGESFFLGTEKGPNGLQACAPAGENSASFYEGYPSVSHHIIAAGVGHADMVDDQKECGMYCSACANSGDNALNQQFMSYTGGLMAAFFNSTLKGKTQYEALLNDSSTHPFQTVLTEHK